MAARWVVVIAPTARRELERLEPQAQRRIARAISALAADPRPSGAKPLARPGGGPRIWRIRVGDYRVIYEIRDGRLLVLVVRLGHRRDVYRGS